MVEYIGNLTEESLLISESEDDLYSDTFDLGITPMCRNTTIKLHFFHILTVELVDRHDSYTDSSYDLISRLWIAALCFFVGDIALFSDDDIALVLDIYFFRRSFLFYFFWRFYLSEKFSYHIIIDTFEYASWLS